jgi:hypothetical protein
MEIMRRQAVTDQDKFEVRPLHSLHLHLSPSTEIDAVISQILDARDRLLRLRGLHQRSAAATGPVAALVGTCGDMCPEKERYSRAAKNQLR